MTLFFELGEGVVVDRRCLRGRVTFALFGEHMQDFRALASERTDRADECRQVVTINRA